MHEYSIVSAVVAQVEDVVRKHESARVSAVRVRIGELAGVEVDLLRTAWQGLTPRTCCEGARLEVERESARWCCRGCGAEVATGLVLVCERCGAPARLVAGDALLLERIEMEVETNDQQGGETGRATDV